METVHAIDGLVICGRTSQWGARYHTVRTPDGRQPPWASYSGDRRDIIARLRCTRAWALHRAAGERWGRRWDAFAPRGTGDIRTAREARRYRRAVARAEAECARMAGLEARVPHAERTVRDVLSLRPWRRAILALRAEDTARRSRPPRQYSAATDAIAPRSVIAAAAAYLAARDERRRDRAAGDAARRGPSPIIGRWPAIRTERAAARAAARKASILGRLRRGQRVGRGSVDDLVAIVRGDVSADADLACRAVVAAVGTIGEQAEDDLCRMTTHEQFSGRRGRHHRRARSTISSVEHLPDWSAALIGIADYVSFGCGGDGGDGGYESRRGVSYRAYAVVRDATTGTAHVIRVAPRWVDARTAAWLRCGSAVERVRAAVASTFGRAAAEYHPDIEA